MWGDKIDNLVYPGGAPENCGKVVGWTRPLKYSILVVQHSPAPSFCINEIISP